MESAGDSGSGVEVTWQLITVMSLIAQSAGQKARIAGFKASLRMRGRLAAIGSANEDDDKHQLTILVEDTPVMSDPDRPAQAQNPVYATVACLAGSVENPREVGLFTEVKTQKVHKVLAFIETSGDQIGWKWTVESQRDIYPSTNPEEAGED